MGNLSILAQNSKPWSPSRQVETECVEVRASYPPELLRAARGLGGFRFRQVGDLSAFVAANAICALCFFSSSKPVTMHNPKAPKCDEASRRGLSEVRQFSTIWSQDSTGFRVEESPLCDCAAGDNDGSAHNQVCQPWWLSLGLNELTFFWQLEN